MFLLLLTQDHVSTQLLRLLTLKLDIYVYITLTAWIWSIFISRLPILPAIMRRMPLLLPRTLLSSEAVSSRQTSVKVIICSQLCEHPHHKVDWAKMAQRRFCFLVKFSSPFSSVHDYNFIFHCELICKLTDAPLTFYIV